MILDEIRNSLTLILSCFYSKCSHLQFLSTPWRHAIWVDACERSWINLSFPKWVRIPLPFVSSPNIARTHPLRMQLQVLRNQNIMCEWSWYFTWFSVLQWIYDRKWQRQIAIQNVWQLNVVVIQSYISRSIQSKDIQSSIYRMVVVDLVQPKIFIS